MRIRIARRMRICGSSKRARAPSRGRSPRRRRAKADGRRGVPMAAAWPSCIGDTDRFAQYSLNKLIVVPSNPPAVGGAGDQAADLHAVARSRRVEPCVVGRRSAHLVPAAGRSDESSRDRARGESERHAAAPHHRPSCDQLTEPGQGRQLCGAGHRSDAHERGLRARRLEPPPADQAQRQAAWRIAAGHDRGLPVEEQGWQQRFTG